VTRGEIYKDKKGKQHQNVIRRVEYNLAVSLYVIDSNTSKVLISRVLESRRTDSSFADMKEPDQIDYESLFNGCAFDIAYQFGALIAPHNIIVKVKLEKDSVLPEIEKAIAYLQMDEYDRGMTMLKSMTEKTELKPKVLAKTYYNYGMMLVYSGDYFQGHKYLLQAFELMPKSSKYQNAVREAKNEMEQARRLGEQM